MKRFLIVLAIVVAAYVIFFNPFRSPSLWFGQQRTSETVTEQVENVEINVGSIKTEVVLDSGNRVKAELRGRGSVSVRRTGESINVQTHPSPFSWQWWNHSKLIITLPRSYADKLQLTVGSGMLTFNHDSSAINYRTLQVNVSSGSVQLNKVSSDRAQLKVHSGSLNMDHFSGAFTAQVQSGKAEIDLAKLKGSSSVSVNSGFAHVNLPDHADFHLKGKSNSGLIRCTLPLKEKVSGNGVLNGVRGSGKYPIDATVNSGLLRIE
ncbi:DUF4097 domain-containing protein [Sporolactobacillus sp. CPB3-1]|uniref:DUF4097 domain-containing protein n=1 Tax=Sporolactobacillus mangiferae TaxID=2940498 RepID=A0ABT0MAM9_9BACL|nr:DUF4097 family beta strand repeat-containing protein [Sporolactobacillus mangiferae]MCL1631718.1 DUF4097 domain-containing protein [Sporolactobacillus mangiferae]